MSGLEGTPLSGRIQTPIRSVAAGSASRHRVRAPAATPCSAVARQAPAAAAVTSGVELVLTSQAGQPGGPAPPGSAELSNWLQVCLSLSLCRQRCHVLPAELRPPLHCWHASCLSMATAAAACTGPDASDALSAPRAGCPPNGLPASTEPLHQKTFWQEAALRLQRQMLSLEQQVRSCRLQQPAARQLLLSCGQLPRPRQPGWTPLQRAAQRRPLCRIPPLMLWLAGALLMCSAECQKWTLSRVAHKVQWAAMLGQ